ncbi:MAG: hypothetical protein ACYDGR_12220 [Candidatus Dormibacteria bacterium]
MTLAASVVLALGSSLTSIMPAAAAGYPINCGSPTPIWTHTSSNSFNGLLSPQDPDIVRSGNQWVMLFGAQKQGGNGSVNIYAASLQPNESLSATDWTIASDSNGLALPIPPTPPVGAWDAFGAETPHYVYGYDQSANQWVQRIYYMGYADSTSAAGGPWEVGFLQYDATTGQWVRHGGPVFSATQNWEGNVVAEPDITYTGGSTGTWHLWYSTGIGTSNPGLYASTLGYAESSDGISWGAHTQMFAPAASGIVYDNSVVPANSRYEEVVAARQEPGYPSVPGSNYAPYSQQYPNGLLWSWSSTPDGAGADWNNNWTSVLSPDSSSAHQWFNWGLWHPAVAYEGTTMYTFFNTADVDAGTNSWISGSLGRVQCSVS